MDTEGLRQRTKEVLDERERVKRERDIASQPFNDRIRDLDNEYHELLNQRLNLKRAARQPIRLDHEAQ